MGLSNEVKVGIFTIIAIGVLLISTIYLANVPIVKSGYKFYVVFDSTPDLKLRAKVKIGGGYNIGTVSNISLTPEGKIKVELAVNKKVKIKKDASITVFTSGVMGEKFVNVIGGTDKAGYVSEGEILYGTSTGGIDSAINNLTTVSSDFRKVVMSLTTLLEGDLRKSLISSVKNVDELSNGVKELIEKNRASIDKSVENFKRASEELAVATNNLKELVGQLNKLVADVSRSNLPETMNNLNKISVKIDETVNSLDSAAKKIDKGEGTLGVLINDKKMAEDLKAAVKDIKDNPWKLLWKK